MPHKRAKASIRKEKSQSIGSDLPPNQPISKKRSSKSSSSSDSKNKRQNSNDENDKIPKNMYRILNAERIRADYKKFKSENKTNDDRKRKSSSGSKHKSFRRNDDGLDDRIKGESLKGLEELKILPGEKLFDFNKRVEDTMRPKITSAMKSARSKLNSGKKDKEETKDDRTKEGSKVKEGSRDDDHQRRPKEFEPRPNKFPLSNIAMEPPTIKLRKDYSSSSSSNSIFKKAHSSSTNKDSYGESSKVPIPIPFSQKRLLEDEREKVIKRYRILKEEKLRNK